MTRGELTMKLLYAWHPSISINSLKTVFPTKTYLEQTLHVDALVYTFATVSGAHRDNFRSGVHRRKTCSISTAAEATNDRRMAAVVGTC